MILREAVLSTLAKNNRDSMPVIPILVKANILAKCIADSFERTIDSAIREDYGLGDFSIEGLSSAELSLYIDGLDEIVDTEARSRLIELLLLYERQHPEVQIVLTSRFIKDVSVPGQLPSFQRWMILPFNLIQITNFIDKWFTDSDAGHRLLAALKITIFFLDYPTPRSCLLCSRFSMSLIISGSPC
jgi:predicted NACHT family NTPase